MNVLWRPRRLSPGTIRPFKGFGKGFSARAVYKEKCYTACMATFEGLYRKLNSAQKQAVDTIEGPVMVIAGPGTGKTQILTLRIANILKKTDTPPDAILALTFTEAGVFAMRKRLVEIIGSDGYRVGIFTFHGFCNELIRGFPDEFPRIIGSQNITDIDKIQILKEIILASELVRLKPFGDPYYYLKDVGKAISDLKRENISPDEAKKRVAAQREEYGQIDDLIYDSGAHKGKIKGKYKDLEKNIEKNEDLVTLYFKYEEALRDKKLYDYEDMIVETISALQHAPDFLLQVQEEYHYILADEHQDANNSQNTLLELLASFHEHPNLFLVGDAKQAIYRFQGASLENFLYFKDRYPGAALVQLEDNYRSRQSILDSSFSLIAQGELSEHELTKPLTSHLEGKDDRLTIASFSSDEYEALYVGRHIQELVDQGIPAEEIAVLYRNNGDVEKLIPTFERLNIPFVIESDQNVLADDAIRTFITLLKAVSSYGNNEMLMPVLFLKFIGIAPLDAYRMLRLRSETRKSMYELIASKKLMEEHGIEDVELFLKLSTKLSGWKTLAQNHGLLFTLERIADESGFIASVLDEPEGREKLEKFRGFIRNAESLVEVHREYQLWDFLQYLGLLEEHNVSIKGSKLRVTTPSIRLMTAHKSKGLEFDYVFIIGAYDGHWGNKRRINHFSIPITEGETDAEEHDAMNDERRLFYVALTRARHGVTITYAKESMSGRMQLPTQFIQEIDEKYRFDIDTDAFEAKVDPLSLLAPRIPNEQPVNDITYLRELFLEQGLSVTALNSYLRSPWEYFFGNMLRVPKAPDKHMLYGTAVHAALRELFERVRLEESFDKEFLLTQFKMQLMNQPLSEHDFEEALKKGNESLAGYFDTYKKQLVTPLATEFNIVVNFPINDHATIPLRGILDKIQVFDGNRVHVVDYKTGKPKSRNDIEGNTKSSHGDYKRQLVFYKLLLSLHEEGKYIMDSGEIDFVEPDKNGKYKKEVFNITDLEVGELQQEIKRVANEILELDFWGSECDPKECKYCHLVESLH